MQSNPSPLAHGFYGQVTAVGLTAAGRPALWHVLTARGKPSRQRRARVRRLAAGQTAVEIAAWGTTRREAAPATPALRLHAAAGGTAFAVAGSGLHIVELSTALEGGASPPQALQAALARWGPEDPPYRTPRTAAVLLSSPFLSWMGATTEPGDASVAQLTLAPGRFLCLPTASGATGSTAPIGTEMDAELVEVQLGGRGVEELAGAAYGLFDPELIVSAGVAVWNGGAWEVALKNLHPE